MNTCTRFQEQLNDAALGIHGVDISPNRVTELSAHASACPDCAAHVTEVVLIAAAGRDSQAVPSPSWEAGLHARLAQHDRKTPGRLVRAALILAALTVGFAVGRLGSSGDGRPGERSFVTTESAGDMERHEDVPSLALETHEYREGFLTGKTLVIQSSH